jgi:NMT1/THI5 like
MTAHFTRRSALTIIACGGASVAAGRAWAEEKAGRAIYPVAVPVYQTHFVADRIGYFKEAGLDCKLIQGGSGVKTREIIASSQGDIGIGDIPSDAAQQSWPQRAGLDASRHPKQFGDVHYPQGPEGSKYHDAAGADGLEEAGWAQTDRLGVIVRGH